MSAAVTATATAASAAAVILIRQNKMVRRFREAQATDLEHAVALEALGERHSWLFDRMARHGVFLSAPGGRFYMDERAADEFFVQRRKRALFILGCLLLALLLLWQFGFFGK